MPALINSYLYVKLGRGDFCLIMKEMNYLGWRSVWWQSQVAILNLAGIELSDKVLTWVAQVGGTNEKTVNYSADVFIKDGLIYYLNLDHPWSEDNCKLEMGVISNEEDFNYDLLRPFMRAFTSAIGRAFDGRKARHIINKRRGWQKLGGSRVVSNYLWDKKYDYVSFDLEEQIGAACLADEKCRSQLIAMLKRGKPSPKISGNVWESLESAKLVESVQSDSLAKVSDLGRQLLRGNDWMTIWLVNILIKNRVSRNEIIAKIQDGSEEVDVAIGLGGKTWVFELKGKIFETGDAHRLLARRARFKPDQFIIITTDKVSPDAKRIIDEVQKPGEVYPVLIEGLENVEDILSKLISNTLLNEAMEKCHELSKRMNINLTPLWTELYGKFHRVYKGLPVRQ